MLTKLTGKYLIDRDSHCKDLCISFFDIRNMMIPRFKKTFVLKQSTAGSTVYVTNRDGEYQRLAAECERLTRILVTTQCLRGLP